jgi:membrane protein
MTANHSTPAPPLSQQSRGFIAFSRWHRTWWVEGVATKELAVRVWKGLLADRVFGYAAELGFYFLFALFPTLFCAGSILGFVARSAHQISDRLLEYLALVIPTSALGTVLDTFNETTAAASSGKLTFGSIAAIWSASVGISAIQDTLNAVFKLEDRRSYVAARINAILLTILLTVLIGLGLGCLFASDFYSTLVERQLGAAVLSWIAGAVIRLAGWSASGCFLALSFAVTYFWAPDWRKRHWQWFSPGTVLGITGWLIISLGFRIYLHFFNSYTVTYGSLGAVIILLMWFYISGLMLLLGAEIDAKLEEAAELESRPQTSQPKRSN